MYYDTWHFENLNNGSPVLEFSGVVARPPVDSDLFAHQERCARCGVVRIIQTTRAHGPLCQDCKGSLTKDQQRKWK